MKKECCQSDDDQNQEIAELVYALQCIGAKLKELKPHLHNCYLTSFELGKLSYFVDSVLDDYDCFENDD